MAPDIVVQQVSRVRPSYTDQQHSLIFEVIATTANTLSKLAMRANVEAGQSDAAYDWHVVQMLAERIGALADLPNDGEVLGSFDDWTIGPLFNYKSEEAAHG